MGTSAQCRIGSRCTTVTLRHRSGHPNAHSNSSVRPDLTDRQPRSHEHASSTGHGSSIPGFPCQRRSHRPKRSYASIYGLWTASTNVSIVSRICGGRLAQASTTRASEIPCPLSSDDAACPLVSALHFPFAAGSPLPCIKSLPRQWLNFPVVSLLIRRSTGSGPGSLTLT